MTGPPGGRQAAARLVRAGAHRVAFDASGTPAGVYLVRLRTAAAARTRTVTHL